MEADTIWGHKIRRKPNGRRIWPAALKGEAVRRIRVDGEKPRDVAAEVGITDAHVRKWMRVSDAPAIIAGGTSPFVEMRVEGGSALTESEQASKLHEFDRLSNNTLSAPVNPPSCRLIFRDLALEFPASINAAALASFVAVLREGAPS